MRALLPDLAAQIDVPPRLGADRVQPDDDRGLVKIFPLQHGLDRLGELLAGAPRRAERRPMSGTSSSPLSATTSAMGSRRSSTTR